MSIPASPELLSEMQKLVPAEPDPDPDKPKDKPENAIDGPIVVEVRENFVMTGYEKVVKAESLIAVSTTQSIEAFDKTSPSSGIGSKVVD